MIYTVHIQDYNSLVLEKLKPLTGQTLEYTWMEQEQSMYTARIKFRNEKQKRLYTDMLA